MDKLRLETPDLLAGNVAMIAEIFPAAVAEGKVNFDALRTLLGDDAAGDEAYEFTWVGKREAMIETGRPVRKTLRPVVEDEVAPTGTDCTGQPYCSSGSKNWETTENLYLEGDNLDVLKLLQESYLGKVKMIYIDPPYNTGNDFVYRDNFTQSREDYDEETGVCDEDGSRLYRNTESNGRFHSDWCSMMYPRLLLARNLLCDDGVIIVSIDDNEVDNLIKLGNEAFGEANFVACFPWRKRTAKSDVPFGISQDYEWIISFAKSGSFHAGVEGGTRKYYETPDLPDRPWRIHDLTKQTSASERPNSFFTLVDPKTGKEYPASPNRTWAITVDTYKKYCLENRIVFPGDYDFLNISKPAFRYFQDEDERKAGELFGFIPLSTKLPDNIGMSQDGTKDFNELFGNKGFAYPKPVNLLKYLVSAITPVDKNVIVLDFFSGSATTAHAVMQLNAEDGGKRKFIMVQLPEETPEGSEARKAGYSTIAEIGKERIRRAGEKVKEEAGLLGQDLDIGFRVFKLDDSNMKDVYYSAGEYTQEMLAGLESNIKEDRTDLDLLYSCVLEWGLPLNKAHKSESIAGVVVHTYGEGGGIVADELIACFAENISEEAIREIASRKPLRVVFRDSSFASSPEKINVEEIFKTLAPDTRVKVI